MKMENDPSYVVNDVSNADGKKLRIHAANGVAFSNTKTEVIFACKDWVKRLGPYASTILFLSLLVLLSLDRLLDIQVHRSSLLIIFVISTLLYIYLNFFLIQEEEIICVRNLGIEIMRKTITGRIEEEYIPNIHIADVVINEVIYMQRFIYVLQVLVGDNDTSECYKKSGYSKINRVVTLFKFTKPRLPELQKILKDTMKVLTCESGFRKDIEISL